MLSAGAAKQQSETLKGCGCGDVGSAEIDGESGGSVVSADRRKHPFSSATHCADARTTHPPTDARTPQNRGQSDGKHSGEGVCGRWRVEWSGAKRITMECEARGLFIRKNLDWIELHWNEWMHARHGEKGLGYTEHRKST